MTLQQKLFSDLAHQLQLAEIPPARWGTVLLAASLLASTGTAIVLPLPMKRGES